MFPMGLLVYKDAMIPKGHNGPMSTKTPRLTLAVLNQKGGVGKTTTSVNLAAAAHLDGHRTLILDLDAQGSALDWSAARREGSKLDGLAVAKVDKALTLPRFRELTAGFDVAILDGPPRLSDITRSAALAADVVLVPLRPGVFDWWAVSDTLSLLDSADLVRAELGKPAARRVFLLNGFDGRTATGRQALDALGQVGELAATTIASRVAFVRASMEGEAVLTFEPDGAAAAEVRTVWAGLAPREEACADG